MPESVVFVKHFIFYSCAKLKRATLKSGMIIIKEGCFGDCAELTDVVIPKSIKKVEYDAFKGCAKLKNIYYGGSEEDWNNLLVNVCNGNDELKSATVHFNSEEIPNMPVISEETTVLTVDDGKAAVFNVKLKNIYRKSCLIAIIYSEDKTVAGAALAEINVGDTEKSLIVNTESGSAAFAKVLIWSDMSSVMPISEVYSIDLKAG